ncbi:MAG: hypothetical protein GYA24_06375, partial [Candidatus Lokiarchaeota archaeon]|nr:hypothetical protein [Candidatus Lokiarchaeota archaeon]
FGAGASDAFIAKFAENGTQLWNRTWGGTADDRGFGVAVATDGIYQSGYTASFGAGSNDAFITKFASNGTQLWNRTWGGTGDDSARCVAPSDDSVYLTGYAGSFGAGVGDAFITKFASNGTQLWNRTWGGTGADAARSVVVDATGVYISGSTGSFGAGLNDAFIVKLSANGLQLWNWTWGGVNNDDAYEIRASTEGIYICGNTGSYGAGGTDAFLVKWSTVCPGGEPPLEGPEIPGAPGLLLLATGLLVVLVVARRVATKMHDGPQKR